MIRIDEIYQNVFLPLIRTKAHHSMHWFDPFGSTKYENICSAPVVSGWRDDLQCPNFESVRYLFWDQEPLHADISDHTLAQFAEFSKFATKHLITSEKNSEFVDRVSDRFDFRCHYYFFHAWAALDWYRGYDKSFLWIPFEQREIKKKFLCMNNIIGGQRKHRLLFFKELVSRGLLSECFVSFPERCPWEGKTVAELYHDNQIEIDLGSVELPLKIDDFDSYHLSSSSKIDCFEVADQSLIHVVTETLYHGKRLHLTEKSFKPMVLQQPFVLISCQNSLEYLRGYGFRTFQDFWDESYDQEDDDHRIAKIGKLCEDLANLSDREIRQMQKYLHPIVKHNFDWFYSREFENLLWQELSDMIRHF